MVVSFFLDDNCFSSKNSLFFLTRKLCYPFFSKNVVGCLLVLLAKRSTENVRIFLISLGIIFFKLRCWIGAFTTVAKRWIHKNRYANVDSWTTTYSIYCLNLEMVGISSIILESPMLLLLKIKLFHSALFVFRRKLKLTLDLSDKKCERIAIVVPKIWVPSLVRWGWENLGLIKKT